MPLDLRSNDLEARITVASKLREDLMFSRMGEYEQRVAVGSKMQRHTRGMNVLFAKKPLESLEIAHNYNDYSQAIGSHFQQCKNSYHHSI